MQAKSDRIDALKRTQAERRGKLEGEGAALKARQTREREDLDRRLRGERQTVKDVHDTETRRVRLQRLERRLTGLVAFLARVTGIEAVRRKLHKHQDKRRNQRFAAERKELDKDHVRARLDLQRRHEAQNLDMQRHIRALDQVEARELQSLETTLLKEQRVKTRGRGSGGSNRMPALTLELKPPGRKAADHKAKNRYASRGAFEERTKPESEQRQEPLSVREIFERAATEGKAGGNQSAGSSDSVQPKPKPPRHPDRGRKRDRNRDWER